MSFNSASSWNYFNPSFEIKDHVLKFFKIQFQIRDIDVEIAMLIS